MSRKGKSDAFKRIQRGKFALKPGFLDQQSKRWAGLIPQDSPTETIEGVLKKVRSGELTIADVFEDEERVGFTIFSIEENDAGREFLSVASYGKSDYDLSRAIIPILEDLARDRGCKTIRLHTMRQGLCRKLIDLDWFVSEIVMRKEL